MYFITICCQNRICRFGQIDNGIMILNEFGNIANNEWTNLIKRFPNIQLGAFQIMPNHMHGIIEITNAVGLGFTPDPIEIDIIRTTARVVPNVVSTVGAIVGAYKSLVANNCLNIYKSKNEIMGKLWQRNYYEHIIRDEKSHQQISNYIFTNPEKWQSDKFYWQ